jgi:hypothetical protein
MGMGTMNAGMRRMNVTMKTNMRKGDGDDELMTRMEDGDANRCEDKDEDGDKEKDKEEDRDKDKDNGDRDGNGEDGSAILPPPSFPPLFNYCFFYVFNTIN